MIPIARPLMGDEEVRAAQRAILSGWITQGPEVLAFEQAFAHYVGARHACAVSNCTAALQLALLALGVAPGDEIVTVSHSFIATANSIRHCGATPVFVDIDAATYNLDTSQLREAITSRTRAIVCVHQMGMPCDLRAVLEIARAHTLPVVEDAACAIGSEVRVDGAWQRIGRPHGDIACFSFHPRKVVSTGDGGMIVTRDDAHDARLRLLRQHGMSLPDTVRHGSSRVLFETYPIVGFNFRLTDIQAAVGREQLARLPAAIERRRQLAARYHALLAALPGVRAPHEPDWARSNWQSYCVRLPERCDQRSVMQAMLDDGVATRRGIMCAHREASYRDVPLHRPLPRSERAQDHCILLPLYPQLTEAEQDTVVAALARACAAPASASRRPARSASPLPDLGDAAPAAALARPR